MTNYSNAANYERGLVKHLLSNQHALYATRTPGSRSPVDVIGIFPSQDGRPHTHLIQCKNGSSRPKRSEIDYLKFMREKGCDAYYMSRGKKTQEVFCRYELEDVEAGVIGPILDDGMSDMTAASVDRKLRTTRKK